MRRSSVLMIALSVVAAATVGTAGPVRAAAPQVVTLPLPAGSAGTEGVVINRSGEVAGNAYPATTPGDETRHVFRWNGRASTDLTAPPLGFGDVKDMNDAGTIVGTGVTTAAPYEGRAYVWRGAKAIWIRVPGEDPAVGDEAHAINNAGQVLVNVDNSVTWIWANGLLTRVGPGVGSSINASGQVTGTRTATDGTSTGFVWTRGRTTNLVPPAGWTSTEAVQINDRGQVLGDISRVDTSNPASPVTITHAGLWDHGTFTDLDPGTDNSAAVAINNNGQVIGLTFGRTFGSFFWDRGTSTAIPGLGGFSSVSALNDAGQVVGFGSSATGSRPFVWQNGTTTDLAAAAGAASGYARDINDRGQITGNVYVPNDTHPDETRRAVVWTVTAG